MAVEERDPHTGYLTTGHEWNGIKELNSPVPRAVYVFLIATALFSVGYWILMPAWPTGTAYTKGLLGIDQRTSVEADLQDAVSRRKTWSEQIEAKTYTEIQADPALMQVVRQTGQTLYRENCAVCHGADAKGAKGYPSLTTTSWLWGGEPEALAETIRVGINSAHKDGRVSQMMAFGKDGILKRSEIEDVVAYVRSLSDQSVRNEAPTARLDAGKALYATNCASCHGDNGTGSMDAGAPNLTDRFWIYGGDPQSIYSTVWNGRQGKMPAWEGRLSAIDRKILALYLTSLPRREP